MSAGPVLFEPWRLFGVNKYEYSIPLTSFLLGIYFAQTTSWDVFYVDAWVKGSANNFLLLVSLLKSGY